VKAFVFALAVAVVFPPASAHATEPNLQEVGDNRDEAVTTESDGSDTADHEDRIRDLEQRLADSQDAARRRQPTVFIGGYVDLGFFAPQGDGSGVVQDLGPPQDRRFPDLAGRYGWVFLGDLLAPAVNSRGEPADLGDLPGVDRQDTIHSGGAPGFIANEVNLTLQSAVASNALVTASVNFLPRTGHEFRLGDVFDVDIAQVEWMPTAGRRWSIFAGKTDSVVGIEYRRRKARDRFGITPSLIARYTTGTPLGVKARGKLGRGDWLVVAAALTNGSPTVETFHFYDEVDSNAGKTASARLAVAPWEGAIEVGISGAYGPQDHARDSRDAMWFAGVDFQAHRRGLDLQAQWLIGRAPGEQVDRVYDPDHRPYGLRLNGGGYLESDLMLTPLLGLIGRAEYRDALVWLGNPAAQGGAERLYVTKVWRATAGIRFVPTEHVAVKAEFLHNGEYGRLPHIRDDVFVTSLLLSY
jgi:hypothetical protein